MNATSSSTDDLLLVDLRDAAKMLSLSEKSVWTLAKAKRIPSIKLNSSRRFSVAELKAWIAKEHKAQAG